MPRTEANVTLDDTVTWSGKHLAAKIGDEVVLMNTELDRYYSLDDIGSEVWRTLERPVRIDGLCQVLAAQYHADPATVAADVLALLDRMLEQQLISIVGG